MKRREFIAGLGSAAAWPLAARAQQPAIPVVGYLNIGAPDGGGSTASIVAFRKGLSETGYVEGRNVAIEFRWAGGQFDRLPELAADLVRRRVAVIYASGSTAAALAAKAATATVPIIFNSGGDPLQYGLVASLNRPGGNITGVTSMSRELMTKRLELLHELVPGVRSIGLLVVAVAANPNIQPMITEFRAAASAIGLQIEVLFISTNRDIDTAFASLVENRIDALVVNPNPLFGDRRVQLVTQAARHAVPAIYYFRDFVEAGGLMSYGTRGTDLSRQAGIYAGRILKGEKPADLPVMRSTKFEFIINLQTAKVLGIEVPATLLAQADEVIE
jgi:putative ABC transport system substrate-binding protein